MCTANQVVEVRLKGAMGGAQEHLAIAQSFPRRRARLRQRQDLQEEIISSSD